MSDREAARTSTEEWKWRRREAIIRDDYACQECGAKGGPKGDADLEAHHDTPVSEGGSDDLGNLVTLCTDCHGSHHFNEKEEYLDAVREHEPAGTNEVAEAVGVTRQGADYRLPPARGGGDGEAEDGRKLAGVDAC